MREFPRSASMRAHYHVATSRKLISTIREPIWTNHEVEKFWLVLEPHMKLLSGGESPLPDPDVDFSELDPQKISHFESCLLDVQELIWRGKYSLAVSNLRSIKHFFGQISSERYRIAAEDSELSALRALFVRRMPR